MSVRPARRGPARRGPALRAASRGPASRARQASRGGREGPAILGAGGRPGACHRGREPGQGRVPEESCGGWDPRPRARPAPDLHWPPGRRGGGCLPPPPLPPHPLPPAPPSSLLSVPTGVRNVGVLGKDNVRVKKMGLAAGRRGCRAGPAGEGRRACGLRGPVGPRPGLGTRGARKSGGERGPSWPSEGPG